MIMHRMLPGPCLLALLLVAHAPGASARPTAGAPARDTASVKNEHALEVLLGVVERNVVSCAEAMPADKFGFAPTEGEFTGVRTFGRQVKHLAATNYILAAAALGQEPPADAGDEAGPDTVRTKEQVLRYARGSFAAIRRACAAIGDESIAVRTSPISPLQGKSATRPALITEALVHSYDHYGQMVVYLRMNGVVPPASRP
jgi:uncharacterized damage-inducible protein DinB